MALALAGCSSGSPPSSDGTSTSAPDEKVGGAPRDTRTDVAAVGSAPEPATPSPAPDVEVTLAFGGDLLPHLPIDAVAQERGAAAGVPYDFGLMLGPLAPVVGEADLALCHLEVPLVADGQAVSGYPSFHAPRELAAAVDAVGYDGCSTASNHSLDGGRDGISATLGTFDLLGLGHTGTARGPEEASGPAFYDAGGARVAHLSYAYGFNGIPLPEDAPWAANGIDPVRIAADAQAAAAFGAQLVVVSLHWGDEYQSEPSGFQQEVATILSGVPEIDLVIGHHAHVVQPIERVGPHGTWVVYGLGNQLANQPQLPRRDGLTVVVTAGGPAGGSLDVRRLEAVPTYVDTDTFAVLPVAESLADPALPPERRAELEGSLTRTMEVVNRRGASVPVHAWG